jgi:hypothetical protein
MLRRSDAAVTISSMVVSTRYDGSIDVRLDSSTIDRPVEPDMTSRGEERRRRQQNDRARIGVGIVSDDRRRSDGMDATDEFTVVRPTRRHGVAGVAPVVCRRRGVRPVWFSSPVSSRASWWRDDVRQSCAARLRSSKPDERGVAIPTHLHASKERDDRRAQRTGEEERRADSETEPHRMSHTIRTIATREVSRRRASHRVVRPLYPLHRSDASRSVRGLATTACAARC